MSMRDSSPCPYCSKMVISLPIYNLFGEQVFPCEDCIAKDRHNEHNTVNLNLEQALQSRRVANNLSRIAQQLTNLTELLREKL